jgi:TPP-dependent pyruvate/acetoin dehydrogenase alpha subunit
MFRTWALEQGLLSDSKVKEIEAAVTAEVDDSVKFAEESPKPVRDPRNYYESFADVTLR